MDSPSTPMPHGREDFDARVSGIATLGEPVRRALHRYFARVEVSLPQRRYYLAGSLLARAVTNAERDGVPVRDALRALPRRRPGKAGAEG